MSRFGGLHCAAALSLCLLAAPAWSAYPERQLTIVVPFPAGGPVDTVARKIGAQLAQRLGQPVVVENKPGANTIIGADTVARSAPDGYTLLLTNTGVVQNPWLYKTLPYDLHRDLAPVAQIAQAPLVLVANAATGATSIAGLMDYEAAHRGKTAYASTSIGGTTHIYGEQMKKVGKLATTHVPYKGDAAVLPDLLSNRVQWYFGTASVVLPHMQAGKLNGLGVTGTRRLSALPDIPTMAEAGYAGFEVVAWYGAFVRAGTPAPVVQQLSTAIVDIVRGDELKVFMNDNMFIGAPQDAAQFGATVQRDLGNWKTLIQGNGIKLE